MNKEQKIEMIIERYKKMTPEQKREFEKKVSSVLKNNNFM